jgi:hypothetical protein
LWLRLDPVRSLAVLVNPANPNAEPEKRFAQEAARKLGLDFSVVSAN